MCHTMCSDLGPVSHLFDSDSAFFFARVALQPGVLTMVPPSITLGRLFAKPFIFSSNCEHEKLARA